MGKRHQKLGIKQTIQKPWMDRSVQMMLAGIPEKEIRAELDDYLSTQLQSGGTGNRGPKTYGMAVSILASWFSPDKELIAFPFPPGHTRSADIKVRPGHAAKRRPAGYQEPGHTRAEECCSDCYRRGNPVTRLLYQTYLHAVSRTC